MGLWEERVSNTFFPGFSVTFHGLRLREKEKYEGNKQRQAFFVHWLLACQISRLDAEAISLVFAALHWLLHREVGQYLLLNGAPGGYSWKENLCEPLCVDWKSLIARVSHTRCDASFQHRNNWETENNSSSLEIQTWFLLTKGDLYLWSTELGSVEING